MGAFENAIYEEESFDSLVILYKVTLDRNRELEARIAELERCLKTALEFVPKSVAKRLTVQGGLG